MFQRLTLVSRASLRLLVSQGAGLVGLAWCLAEGLSGLAAVLTTLVLVDQAVFLKGRSEADGSARHYGRIVHAWCFVLGGVDVLICLATIIRGIGLRDGTTGPDASDPVDCLAYVLAMFAHAPTSLVPATATGRLVGAVLALLGAVAFLTGLAATTRWFRRASDMEALSRLR